uniref:duboraya isoform X2 n=1 Tax=Scatophagus argus TaxID=75038 RepID=UPI001ED7FEC8|nr:duboraya isoform X2 [Scatophagus argus]
MEDETPSRRSVAELAGRFKSSAPPPDAAGHETEKPVRRRPPRTLQLAKTPGDDQEPPGVTSPLPAKAKRNSALIEKLQTNLALSPSALLPSPKSPGFRLLPPAYPPPSPTSAQATTVTTLSTASPTSPVAASPLTEEESPSSFDIPPAVGEGSILSNDNIKGRARHSIRRRPPSRRHKKSSSGEDLDNTNDGGEGGGEKEEEGDVFKQEGQTDKEKEDKVGDLTSPERNESHKEDHPDIIAKPREEDEEEGENRSTGGREGDESSPGRKEEEEEAQEKNTEKQEEDLTDSKEEEKTEVTPTCPT